jgi:hypothetical protein
MMARLKMTPPREVRNWESAAKERKSRGRIVLVAEPPGGIVSKVIMVLTLP